MSDVGEYGFRHDPMEFVEKDESLQGAMVRKRVFDRPKPADAGLIQAEIDGILAKQLPDGRLDDHPVHGLQFTAEKLSRLAQMGCDPGRPEIEKAVAAILAKETPNRVDPLGIYDVRAFCRLGLAGRPEIRDLVRTGLQRIVEREAEWSDLREGCPWTPIEHLITLWHGRDVADVEPCLAKALGWIGDGLNAAGCLSFKDPWGFVRLASEVDHPLARAILEKEVPVILRGQRPDGGWGQRSVFVFAALVKHDLLEPLRTRPALPPDWRVVKTIPAPAGCWSLAWDGGRLWTKCGATNEAVALSPAAGTVLQRGKLPAGKPGGLGWWDDALAVTQKEPKTLLKVNPRTGEVEQTIDLSAMDEVLGVTQLGGRLLVGDGFGCNVSIFEPAAPDRRESRVLGGPLPLDLATDGDAVWHMDIWAPALIKSDPSEHGRLLDWGEKPFGGEGVASRGGTDDAHWLLIDYVDVVVHVFAGEFRKYYDLELLWGDAPRIDWKKGWTPREDAGDA